MAYFGIGGPGRGWMPSGGGYGQMFGGGGQFPQPPQHVMPQQGGGLGNFGVPDTGPYKGMWGGKYMPLLQLAGAGLGGWVKGQRAQDQRMWERRMYEQEREDEEERRRRMTQAWNDAISSMGG